MVSRFVRAPFAAVLAFWEEWQPPVAPRRTMADVLNEYEELNETLPESEPVTTSAGEKTYNTDSASAYACHSSISMHSKVGPKSSPVPPAGDLPLQPAQASGMPRGGEAVPHGPTSRHPNVSDWVQATAVNVGLDPNAFKHPQPVVRLPAEFDTPYGLAQLIRHHGLTVEFDT